MSDVLLAVEEDIGRKLDELKKDIDDAQFLGQVIDQESLYMWIDLLKQEQNIIDSNNMKKSINKLINALSALRKETLKKINLEGEERRRFVVFVFAALNGVKDQLKEIRASLQN